MAFEGYVEYQRREFCHDVECPLQTLLDRCESNTSDYQQIRRICQADCLRTTYEFHHWLIEKGYLLIRPAEHDS
jgi:hypothetical protein